MKTTRLPAGTLRSILFVSTLILAGSHSVQGGGVVTNCTEGDLRAAMTGGGTVTFACDGTITLASQLGIVTDTILDATGHSIRLSGGGTTRVLAVQSGVKLTLKRLTVSDGYVSMGFGGGLLNSGDATISDCTFSNNTVTNGPQFGGAINHQGTKLVITGTTFIGNNSEASGGALSCGFPFGSAVGNIAVTNCTFYANGRGAASFSYGISSPVTFVNCTFASNNLGAISASSFNNPTPTHVRVMNSIIAYTVGGDNASGIEDWGNNLSSDNSASLTNATSLRNTDPLLGPLADNGGPTRTMGLLYGSPAIDGANDSAAPATDQRGVARPVNLKSDIGAFESSLSPVTPSTVHFASTNFSAGESQGVALVRVVRAGTSAGTVGVTLSATAGTATAGADFAATNIALVFAEGEMQKSIPIVLFDDPTAETAETVVLTLTNAVGTVIDSPSTAQLTILDDDVAYVLSLTNYSDAGLRAVANGGWIQFPADGTITLTNPITISQFTILDATGHNVVLSGGNAVRMFNITPGASLTLMNLTLANGRNQGFNGAAGTDGGQGSGGAINVDNGALSLIGCRIWTNTVVGGAGGNGDSNGSGGPAVGGAIYVNHGTLNATNSEFIGNLATGGPGGTNSYFSGGGSGGHVQGGHAQGGAVASSGGLLQLDNCSFTSNAVIGGRAPEGTGGNAGTSGEASGGVWFNDGGTAIVTSCSFVLNRGSTPKPIGALSGYGGTVRGGSICNVSGALSILGTEFIGNRVSGGDAVRYGIGGPGLGGAIYNLAILDLSGCFIKNNSAYGGNNGRPGANGQGGAIYNGGQLKITQTEFQTNTVQAGQGYEGGMVLSASGIAQGGAVFTTNVLVLSESTLSGNVAYGAVGGQGGIAGPFPGYPAYGGAIHSTGSSYLTNNTIAANLATGGSYVGGSPPQPGSFSAGGDAYGGGLCQTGGVAFLLNNTFAANAASAGTGYPNGNSYGGGIANQSGAVSLLNTIVANSSSGGNCFGVLTDAGHNLSSDASCNFTTSGSLNNTDPLLYPPGDFGGPTPTMPLLAGSPCIDAADPAAAPPADQRGVSRPYGLLPDIGAYEWNGGGPTPQAPSILLQPQPVTVFVGESVALSVTADGYQPLHYFWRLGGAGIAGATGPAYSFSNAAPSQSGVYTVVVTNLAGAITSAPALVRIKSGELYYGSQMLTNGTYSFASPPTLTIRSAFTNGSSFYTLDGSPPSFASTFYSGPFTVSQSATVRAIGYSADFSQSDEADAVNAIVLVNHTLTTSASGGGTVSLNPPGGTYIATNVVTVTAQPASGWSFLYWLGDGSGPSPSINVSMERDKTVHAVFGTTLSTTVTGNGSVQVFPPGGVYSLGTTVRLTAIPQPGHYFGFWGNAATGNTNPLYFTISGPNPTVSSIFAPLPADQAALTVLVNGHGRVNANPRANAYPTNQAVTLTAVPDSGQSFVNWSGDASGSQNPLVFSMTQSRVITANFTSRPFLRSDRPGLEGLTPGGFRFTVVSDPPSVHQILASTNLTAWTSVGTVTNNFGEIQFMDTNAAGFRSRFYQAAP